MRQARAEPGVLAREASERYGYPPGFLARYFEKLRYRFGPRERAGLFTFMELARDAGELDRDPGPPLRPGRGRAGMKNGVGAVLEKALEGERITDAEALTLLESKDLVAIGKAAESLRGRRTDPGRITFIIDRNVNYTNVCVTDCDFCAFYRRPGDRAEGYLLPKTVIFKKIEETLAIGGTGVLMQGGHHPDLAVDYYEDLFRSIKERYPIHLHALSPPEIQHIARRSKLGIPATLTRLRDAGLDSIPGGGAEILVDRVRDIIAPKKTRTAEWLNVMRHAHRLGMSTTATMMYGHVETLAERIEHMRRIRELQDETRGFRAFISWTFQPRGHAARAARHASPDLARVPAHAGGEPDLPRQRRPHPVVLGDPGDEGRPGRARLRRRRPRLGDDRGERRLGGRDDASRVDRRLHPRDQGARQDPGAARHAVPGRARLELGAPRQ